MPTLDDLTKSPRLFGLKERSADPRRGLLLVVDNHAHAIEDAFPGYARRVTPQEFSLFTDETGAFLDSSSDLMGSVIVRLPGSETPSTWTDLDLVEFDASPLGRLKWQRSSGTFDVGGYRFNGDLPEEAQAHRALARVWLLGQ